MTYKLNKNALCSFIVYSFTQDFNLDKPHSPKVYDCLFLLKSFIPIVNYMLSQPDHEECLGKGIHALDFFLAKIEPMTIEGINIYWHFIVRLQTLFLSFSSVRSVNYIRLKIEKIKKISVKNPRFTCVSGSHRIARIMKFLKQRSNYFKVTLMDMTLTRPVVR